MRTRFEIVLADELDPADLRAAGEEAFDEIERVEAQLSAHRDESELARLNAEAAARPVRVDARFFSLLERAIELSSATDGTFDMTVGPLLKLWNISGGSAEAALPGDSTITISRATIGMREMILLDRENNSVRFAKPGVRLDPGAIGKGYALERAAKLLREAGIVNALLHGGTSSVVALGSDSSATGETGWKIGIRKPDTGSSGAATGPSLLRKGKNTGRLADTLLAEVILRDGQSLSVSGFHGKSVDIGGKRIGHVIDPRSGRPVDTALLSAVISAMATDSDALSTGLLVLGAAGLDIIGAKRPDASLLVAEEMADGGVRVLSRGACFSVCG